MIFSVPLWVIMAACVLDVFFADPPFIPHPVRGIGLWLEALERAVRSHELLTLPLMRIWGVLCVLLSLALSTGFVVLLVSMPAVGTLCALYLSYAGLALGSLLKSCRQALESVETGSLAEARLALSMLVSRDTQDMGRPELRRALAETLSENFNDAFIAPLFYLLLAGPAGLWAYKTVSTMDSMWGYKNERYQQLGWACARLDDVLAYIPARASALFLWLASFSAFSQARLDAWPGWKRVAAQARTMESPNAGWPMSAAAWLHQARMGGATPYFGVMCQKPLLGADCAGREGMWTAAKINALGRHIRCAAVLGTVIMVLCSLLFKI